MADAIRQLQQVTNVPARASVHLLELAERGRVSFEFPSDYARAPYFSSTVPVTVRRHIDRTQANDLSRAERLVLETLFGTTLQQQTTVLTAYKFSELDNRLRELATDELRQAQYIEPSSLVPRLLLACAAILAVGGIAASLWSESKLAGCVLMLLIVFALVVIAREPRGWRASQLGTNVIAQYAPPAYCELLSEAVRRDPANLKWHGLQNSQKPEWLHSDGLWSADEAQNRHVITVLLQSINTAASQPPPPPKTATGQS